jgi:hypothetical protein
MTLDADTLIARLQQDSELARRVDEALREHKVQKRSLAELLAADETMMSSTSQPPVGTSTSNGETR